VRQALAVDGIYWRSRAYHKRFSAFATAYDIVAGAFTVMNWARKEKIGVLHARAHIPLAMALIARRFLNVRLIFDIRGLMAEEYVDAGIWAGGSFPFRVIKRLEGIGLRKADEIVVLTEKFRNYLAEKGLRPVETITVVPCCFDPSRLSPFEAEKRERFELIYAGSVTGLYMLEEMGRLFMVLKKVRGDAFFRVLTAGDPGYVRSVFSRLEIDEADYSVQKVPPAEVLNWIRRSHAAISFRKSTFSQIAASPTKFGEYLASGIPVIVNSGIGDVGEQIEADSTGVVIDTLDRESYLKAVTRVLELCGEPGLDERCRRSAKMRFDLRGVGGKAYCRLYKKLIDSENDW
jgi:glycosyltransferase involved in cell wall biosynthesis